MKLEDERAILRIHGKPVRIINTNTLPHGEALTTTTTKTALNSTIY